MLAMAYFELNDSEKGQKYCQSAIHVYADAGLQDEEQKAHQLMARIGA